MAKSKSSKKSTEKKVGETATGANPSPEKTSDAKATKSSKSKKRIISQDQGHISLPMIQTMGSTSSSSSKDLAMDALHTELFRREKIHESTEDQELLGWEILDPGPHVISNKPDKPKLKEKPVRYRLWCRKGTGDQISLFLTDGSDGLKNPDGEDTSNRTVVGGPFEIVSSSGKQASDEDLAKSTELNAFQKLEVFIVEGIHFRDAVEFMIETGDILQTQGPNGKIDPGRWEASLIGDSEIPSWSLSQNEGYQLSAEAIKMLGVPSAPNFGRGANSADSAAAGKKGTNFQSFAQQKSLLARGTLGTVNTGETQLFSPDSEAIRAKSLGTTATKNLKGPAATTGAKNLGTVTTKGGQLESSPEKQGVKSGFKTSKGPSTAAGPGKNNFANVDPRAGANTTTNPNFDTSGVKTSKAKNNKNGNLNTNFLGTTTNLNALVNNKSKETQSKKAFGKSHMSNKPAILYYPDNCNNHNAALFDDVLDLRVHVIEPRNTQDLISSVTIVYAVQRDAGIPVGEAKLITTTNKFQTLANTNHNDLNYRLTSCRETCRITVRNTASIPFLQLVRFLRSRWHLSERRLANWNVFSKKKPLPDFRLSWQLEPSLRGAPATAALFLKTATRFRADSDTVTVTVVGCASALLEPDSGPGTTNSLKFGSVNLEFNSSAQKFRFKRGVVKSIGFNPTSDEYDDEDSSTDGTNSKIFTYAKVGMACLCVVLIVLVATFVGYSQFRDGGDAAENEAAKKNAAKKLENDNASTNLKGSATNGNTSRGGVVGNASDGTDSVANGDDPAKTNKMGADNGGSGGDAAEGEDEDDEPGSNNNNNIGAGGKPTFKVEPKTGGAQHGETSKTGLQKLLEKYKVESVSQLLREGHVKLGDLKEYAHSNEITMPELGSEVALSQKSSDGDEYVAAAREFRKAEFELGQVILAGKSFSCEVLFEAGWELSKLRETGAYAKSEIEDLLVKFLNLKENPEQQLEAAQEKGFALADFKGVKICASFDLVNFRKLFSASGENEVENLIQIGFGVEKLIEAGVLAFDDQKLKNAVESEMAIKSSAPESESDLKLFSESSLYYLLSKLTPNSADTTPDNNSICGRVLAVQNLKKCGFGRDEFKEAHQVGRSFSQRGEANLFESHLNDEKLADGFTPLEIEFIHGKNVRTPDVLETATSKKASIKELKDKICAAEEIAGALRSSSAGRSGEVVVSNFIDAGFTPGNLKGVFTCEEVFEAGKSHTPENCHWPLNSGPTTGFTYEVLREAGCGVRALVSLDQEGHVKNAAEFWRIARKEGGSDAQALILLLGAPNGKFTLHHFADLEQAIGAAYLYELSLGADSDAATMCLESIANSSSGDDGSSGGKFSLQRLKSAGFSDSVLGKARFSLQALERAKEPEELAAIHEFMKGKLNLLPREKYEDRRHRLDIYKQLKGEFRNKVGNNAVIAKAYLYFDLEKGADCDDFKKYDEEWVKAGEATYEGGRHRYREVWEIQHARLIAEQRIRPHHDWLAERFNIVEQIHKESNGNNYMNLETTVSLFKNAKCTTLLARYFSFEYHEERHHHSYAHDGLKKYTFHDGDPRQIRTEEDMKSKKRFVGITSIHRRTYAKKLLESGMELGEICVGSRRTNILSKNAGFFFDDMPGNGFMSGTSKDIFSSPDNLGCGDITKKDAENIAEYANKPRTNQAYRYLENCRRGDEEYVKCPADKISCGEIASEFYTEDKQVPENKVLFSPNRLQLIRNLIEKGCTAAELHYATSDYAYSRGGFSVLQIWEAEKEQVEKGNGKVASVFAKRSQRKHESGLELHTKALREAIGQISRYYDTRKFTDEVWTQEGHRRGEELAEEKGREFVRYLAEHIDLSLLYRKESVKLKSYPRKEFKSDFFSTRQIYNALLDPASATEDAFITDDDERNKESPKYQAAKNKIEDIIDGKKNWREEEPFKKP